MHYRDYIKSPLWEERKRRYYSAHPKICAVCGYPAVDLHHLVYEDFGYEKDKNLAPLCRLHHEGLHAVAGVRRNSFYQSRGYIETEREKYRSGNFEVTASPAETGSAFGDVIHKTANWIRGLFSSIIG